MCSRISDGLIVYLTDYTENFGIQFTNQAISGELVLNAFGCSLGGGSYFLFEKNGDLIKCGQVFDLALEIYRHDVDQRVYKTQLYLTSNISREKAFFRKYATNYVESKFSNKRSSIVNISTSLTVYGLYIRRHLFLDMMNEAIAENANIEPKWIEVVICYQV